MAITLQLRELLTKIFILRAREVGVNNFEVVSVSRKYLK